MSIREEVKEWIESYPEEDQKVVLEDLGRSGCASGMVGPLIYYTDTLSFYERNKEEINDLLRYFEEDSGEAVLNTLSGYDTTDPLCLEQSNQNSLAWFGFEALARDIYTEKYED